mgnify:FL=1
MSDVRRMNYGELPVEVHPTNEALGEAAALFLIEKMNQILSVQDTVNLIIPTVI